jgi:hypothetical protein
VPQSSVQISGRQSAIGRTTHIRTHRVDGQRRLGWTEHQIATHPGGQIDDDVGIRISDAFDDLTVERGIATGLSRLRIANVAVNDGGSSLGGGDRAGRDVTRRAWNMG